MSTLSTTRQPATTASPRRLLARHPVVAFYLLAFAGSWLAWLPLVLDGFGLLPFGVPRAPFMIVGTFAGPALAAFVMTAVTEGRPGVRQLLQSYVQYRVGIRWYLIVIFWNPIVLLLTASAVLAVSPLSLLARMWPLILSVYLPAIVEILVFAQLWEQVGWRGFALPRLQRKYGPLAASFIVGALVVLWHLPGFFIAGGIREGRVDWTIPLFLQLFVLTLLPATLGSTMYTWIYNNTRGSLFIIILFHTLIDASNRVFFRLIPEAIERVIVAALVPTLVIYVGLIILTRGRLGYRRIESSSPHTTNT